MTQDDDPNALFHEIKLFGKTISVSNDDDGDDGGAAFMRRTKSTGNIEEFIPENAAAAAADDESGSISDGDHHSNSRGRKRGNPWSQEEHLKFLEGLHKLGKGDWKGIASKFVPSRKSSQVASHAQKYFNRLNTTSQAIKKRRRASVFDIASTHDTGSTSSSSAATNVTASEVSSFPLSIGSSSERPPLAPMKQTALYQPSVSSVAQGYQPQPVVSWVPVMNFPNQNGVFMPSIHGGFVPPQLWRQAWIRPPPATTKNDELNLHIKNLTL